MYSRNNTVLLSSPVCEPSLLLLSEKMQNHHRWFAPPVQEMRSDDKKERSNEEKGKSHTDLHAREGVQLAKWRAILRHCFLHLEISGGDLKTNAKFIQLSEQSSNLPCILDENASVRCLSTHLHVMLASPQRLTSQHSWLKQFTSAC